MLLNVKCVLIFSTSFSPTFLILRRSQRHIIVYTDVRRSSCELTVILSDMNDDEFYRQIFEKY